jgi:LysM repeat protein
MKCYACTNEAEKQCGRCGRPYCEDHGEAFCGECLKPASALPSFSLYRGSLLALLIGTALAVWLIVRPPGESNESSPGVALPGALLGQESPTPVPSPMPTGAPAAPGATATPAEVQQYTVQAGDTLYGIAEANLPPGEDLADFMARIAELNDLGNPDEAVLRPGQVLRLSAPAPPLPSASPGQATPSPVTTGTPAARATPAPPATAAPTEVQAHIVQAGETLYGIAEAYLPPGENLGDFVARVAQYNGLGNPDEVILQPGQVIRLPP